MRFPCSDPSIPWSQAYHALVLCVQYIAPVIIMAYSYIMIAVTIWKRREICEVADYIAQFRNCPTVIYLCPSLSAVHIEYDNEANYNELELWF